MNNKQNLNRLHPCPDSNQFFRYIDGALDQIERKALEEHLNLCPSCFKEMTSLVRDTFPTVKRCWVLTSKFRSGRAWPWSGVQTFENSLPRAVILAISSSDGLSARSLNSLVVGKSDGRALLPSSNPSQSVFPPL